MDPLPDDLDPLFKALADPTRRAILDLLRDGPKTTGELTAAFPDLSRFAVMKHLGILKGCDLVLTRAEGRKRVHSIHALPLRQVYERWVRNYEDLWASQLLRLKERVEEDD